MAATTDASDVPSVTAVSSPSARRVYYELEDVETATVAELSDRTDVAPDRVAELLGHLEDRDLVEERETGYAA